MKKPPEIKRGGSTGFHELQAPPEVPDGRLPWKCGWCHGSGFAGEKEPICRGCKGAGWIVPEPVEDKRIRKGGSAAEVEPVPERPPVLASGNDGKLL